MNESILKALMRLFAIIANVNKDGVSSESRTIVEAYLNTHLNHQQVLEYLALFDEYLAFHHRNITRKDGTKVRKRTSSNSVKVLMICEQINEELQQKEKVVVLLRLMEFVYEAEVTEKELDFMKTVADTFKISIEEYDNMKTFMLENCEAVPHKDLLLVIDNNETPTESAYKHLHNRTIQGAIYVLHIASTHTYIFKYKGHDDVYQNGRNIIPDRLYLFDKGSSIRSSKMKPVYYSDVVGRFLYDNIDSKVIFNAEDVEFRFKNSDNGIHKFNLIEESGQLVGIMGGSGVGKSTLLNVLNGNLKPKSGRITVNGLDIHSGDQDAEGIIGFVPQDDLLIEELTVFQNLYFNAKLCFNNFSEHKLMKLVLRVLIDLDLNGIRHLTVGSPLKKFISGGQRKRLNIALELIREPAVMFVDEPTSGLSSMDSDMVMDLLKEQTLKGKLVVVNIHQPSSDIFKLFDKLIILDKGGYPVYYGNPLDAITYFKKQTSHVNADENVCHSCGNVNPEQVLAILESKIVNQYGQLTRNRKISPEEWYDKYQEYIEPQAIAQRKKLESREQLEAPKSFFKLPSMFKQFKIFTIRDVLAKLTDKQYMLINFLEAPLLAVILGFFTRYISGLPDDPGAYVFSENENLPAYIFMSVVVSLFLGMSVSAEEIIKDRKIRKREAFLNLSIFSYLNSKVLTMFTLSALQTLSFVLIGNSILEIQDMWWQYWLVLFTTSCLANMIGLNISAALNSVVTIYILIPFILVPQLLLSGTIVKFNKLHWSLSSDKYVPFVGDVMTSRWAYEALTVAQFKDNKYHKEFFDIEQKKSLAAFNKNYLLSELKTRLHLVEKNLNNEQKQETVLKNLRILKNELSKLNVGISEKSQLKNVDQFTRQGFTPQLANDALKFISLLEKYFGRKFEEANQAKDKKFNQLIEKYGKTEILQLKRDHHNNNLGDLVLNNQEINKIKETNKELIQISEPIYKMPNSPFGRAQFYAPVKKIGGYYIDTFWFNLIVIWLSTLFLYITLLFDGLRRTIDFFSNISIKRKKK